MGPKGVICKFSTDITNPHEKLPPPFLYHYCSNLLSAELSSIGNIDTEADSNTVDIAELSLIYAYCSGCNVVDS